MESRRKPAHRRDTGVPPAGGFPAAVLDAAVAAAVGDSDARAAVEVAVVEKVVAEAPAVVAREGTGGCLAAFLFEAMGLAQFVEEDCLRVVPLVVYCILDPDLDQPFISLVNL